MPCFLEALHHLQCSEYTQRSIKAAAGSDAVHMRAHRNRRQVALLTLEGSELGSGAIYCVSFGAKRGELITKPVSGMLVIDGAT